MKKRLNGLEENRIWLVLGKSLIAGIVMGLLIWFLNNTLSGRSLIINVALSIIAGIIGLWFVLADCSAQRNSSE